MLVVHPMAENVALESPGKRLQKLLKQGKSKILVASGVYEGLTARLASAQGIECVYMVSVY